LIGGEISLVASDHSPCPPAMKDKQLGDFFQAWGGIASLQLGLPAVWHEARKRGATIAQVAEWMSVAPARLAGLSHSKGRLAPGFDADIVVWNPETPVAVNDMTLYHRHALTPYRGQTLTGLVRATYVRGVQVYLDGRVATATPGSLLNDDG
jgi:allantoinase